MPAGPRIDTFVRGFASRERRGLSAHPIRQRTPMPPRATPSIPAIPASAADGDLASRIARADHGAFEALMRKYNGKLFRVARSILKDDSEAEDTLQDAYLDAYRHIGDFRGGSALGTWLTRIVINQALMRLRRQKRDRVIVPFGEQRAAEPTQAEAEVADEKSESPSSAAFRGEVRLMLERRIDELPLAFRTVFVMREVEDMTVEETAECLGIPQATVRTRL